MLLRSSFTEHAGHWYCMAHYAYMTRRLACRSSDQEAQGSPVLNGRGVRAAAGPDSRAPVTAWTGTVCGPQGGPTRISNICGSLPIASTLLHAVLSLLGHCCWLTVYCLQQAPQCQVVWQVLVIFLGASRFMMWHRPSELQPLSAGKEAKVQQARVLHDAKKLGRPFSHFQTALEVRDCASSSLLYRTCTPVFELPFQW